MPPPSGGISGGNASKKSIFRPLYWHPCTGAKGGGSTQYGQVCSREVYGVIYFANWGNTQVVWTKIGAQMVKIGLVGPFPPKTDKRYRVPSNPTRPYFAQKNQYTPILRQDSCTAFPVELFISEKNVTNLHPIKIRKISFQVKKVNPILLRLCKGSGVFKKEIEW